jgi:hypothetical protein
MDILHIHARLYDGDVRRCIPVGRAPDAWDLGPPADY